jgi:hypothetical protein
MSKGHGWRFFQSGGVNQVMLRDAADIAAIEQLDLKLWMALSMPTTGVALDPATAALLDTDKDGRIRPFEVIAAVKWSAGVFADLGLLAKGGDSVPLSNIKDADLLATSRRILENLGKGDAKAIELADVGSLERVFAGTRFNGDGVVPADAAGDDAATRQEIEALIGVMPGVSDRSGRPGVDQGTLDAFLAQAAAHVAWVGRADSDADMAPLGLDATSAASAAVAAVRAKVDDYFARCRLAAFDTRAAAALNAQDADFQALAATDLSAASDRMAAMPLASVAAGKPLPLDGTVNPAWAAAVSDLRTKAVAPLLDGDRPALSESDWAALSAKLAAFDAWRAAKPATAVSGLGIERLRAMLAGDLRDRVMGLIAQDAALAPEYARIAAVDKMVRFQRDLYEVLTNYVNFADFYGRTVAVFQAGTLYLDARACALCIEAIEPAKHAALAGLSGAFLAYCDITRPGGLKKTIVAAVTDGDSDNLMVGRNGVFYDRNGLDWDATITKIVSNPISVREAFWMPYKKLIRMIEEQIAKRAQAAESASTDKLASAATSIATVDQRTAPAAAPAAPKKLDLGTIALIGTAIGGISALVAGFLQALFGLGFWLPLGVLGLLLLISGPSMLLASMKLRQRNLGPLLDASGWAINTRARVNIPFGASLTALAVLPPGSTRMLADPFADKRRPWVLYAALPAVAILAWCWWTGRLDRALPERFRCRRAAVEAPAAPGGEPASAAVDNPAAAQTAPLATE